MVVMKSLEIRPHHGWVEIDQSFSQLECISLAIAAVFHFALVPLSKDTVMIKAAHLKKEKV